MTPYKHCGENPPDETHQPRVVGAEAFSRVAIFNDIYVNQYLFQPNDLMANSFEVLIKTPDYDLQMQQIQENIAGIQETFRNNPELDELMKDLTVFIAGFGNATKKGYSKTGSLGKGLARGNKVENIPEQLTGYTPFIQSANNVGWLSWQNKGAAFLETADVCPYCAAPLREEQKQVVRQVAVEYDSKYVTELQKMLEVFRSLKRYFSDQVNTNIDNMSRSAAGLTDGEINHLTEIKRQIEILHRQLSSIKTFGYVTLKNVDRVVDELKQARINLGLMPHIDTDYTRGKIAPVNAALDQVIERAGKLQGAIRKQAANVRKTIEKHTADINSFLETAGYKYNVRIDENPTEETYKLCLVSTDAATVVTDVKSHLSYGERNAFALVLFMYQALKDDPDLIVLDDPISSFDLNKKYAIMEMLFQGKGSLQGKNVVMLTHDFDPVIDLIHTACIRCRFNPVPVASFVRNANGQLSEKAITQYDIKSFLEIADQNISGEADEINKLIYLRRKLEALGDKGLAWQMLANVFHPDRVIPTIQDGTTHRAMNAEEITEATAIICESIPGFEYDRVYARAHDLAEMIPLYRSLQSNYEKIQLYRIINHGNISDSVFKRFVDEVYHIENDSLFQLNPAEYPTIPDYIIQLCDNHIALLAAGME